MFGVIEDYISKVNVGRKGTKGNQQNKETRIILMVNR